MVYMFLNGGGMRGGPLHDQLQGAPLVAEISSEPEELELGVIELGNGEPSLAMVLREGYRGHPSLVDISTIGSWPAYLAGR
ncbi:MAG: hypothetical protein GEV04_24365 [Actinophytocola sp.]|nr:hypothetical protein [Actinophytocola sp.]